MEKFTDNEGKTFGFAPPNGNIQQFIDQVILPMGHNICLFPHSSLCFASSLVLGSCMMLFLAAGNNVEHSRLQLLPGIHGQKSAVEGFGVGLPSPQCNSCIQRPPDL
eukprot:scaffold23192_cov91-Skeletonema_dohrnii-CCMP3373.AAC.1